MVVNAGPLDHLGCWRNAPEPGAPMAYRDRPSWGIRARRVSYLVAMAVCVAGAARSLGPLRVPLPAVAARLTLRAPRLSASRRRQNEPEAACTVAPARGRGHSRGLWATCRWQTPHAVSIGGSRPAGAVLHLMVAGVIGGGGPVTMVPD